MLAYALALLSKFIIASTLYKTIFKFLTVRWC